MKINVALKNVQHIDELSFSIDLSKNQLMGIVGRNGVGKTTLIKSLQNLSSADTFIKTSADGIFREGSSIEYDLGDSKIEFSFDASLVSLNSKQEISDEIRAIIDVELPLPFGQRFNFYQSISSADSEIRQAIVLGRYEKPVELIKFMKAIYNSDKFDDLVKVDLKNVAHYCILLPDSRYIREDYLSSGEYFLISLYRKIQSRSRLIVIDEIDLSLDAAAQANLVNLLRKFCTDYNVNILFTTHSLAMMQTLRDGELYQMRRNETGIEVVAESYSYIKSTLFGFKGWDRYILTEDKQLVRFLTYVVGRYCGDIFCEYKMIYIGTAMSVVDLMTRNASEEYLSVEKNVISILDGDQKVEKYAQIANVYFLPIESVEKELFTYFKGGMFPALGAYVCKDPKKLFKRLISAAVLSEEKIFELICNKNDAEMSKFALNLTAFLSPN